jgi:ferredoxin
MYQTLKQKKYARQAKLLREGIKPISIDWKEGGAQAVLSFNNGENAVGSCIRCINPPCLEYSDEELTLSVFKDFPYDQNNNVCPTSAISWPIDSAAPKIAHGDCIMCGVCVGRCPVKAIWLTETGANINDIPNDCFLLAEVSNTEKTTSNTTKIFNGVNEKGLFLKENESLLKNFEQKFIAVLKLQNAQFPNLLTRNLLLSSGIGAAMRRRGDTNIRMDMVFGPPGVTQGTGEVELGSGVLDAPRNILDNIAVLVGRYNILKTDISPIIVCFALPNKRSEYWQVIKDIKDVLDVKICTISIGALVVFVWNRVLIKLRSGYELYLDSDNPSLRPKIEEILNRKLNLIGGYPGFLESDK